MKKILLIAVALICSVAASAVDVNQLRIYINPGHGSWTPNDRPCTLVGHGAYSRVNTDTLSFFNQIKNCLRISRGNPLGTFYNSKI